MSISSNHRFFLLSLFALNVWSLCTTTLGSFTSEIINGIIDSLRSFKEITDGDIGWLEIHARCVRARVGLLFVDSQSITIGCRRAELINGETSLLG